MVALRTVPIGLLTDMRKRAIKRNVYKIIHKTPQGRGNTHIESDLLRQGVHIWDGVLGSMSLCLYVSFLLDALALLASSNRDLKFYFWRVTKRYLKMSIYLRKTLLAFTGFQCFCRIKMYPWSNASHTFIFYTLLLTPPDESSEKKHCGGVGVAYHLTLQQGTKCTSLLLLLVWTFKINN